MRELRNEFAEPSKWLDRGETVQILKSGRPFARLVPEPKQPRTFLGACPGPCPLPPDIDDPLPVEWEAAQ